MNEANLPNVKALLPMTTGQIMETQANLKGMDELAEIHCDHHNKKRIKYLNRLHVIIKANGR